MKKKRKPKPLSRKRLLFYADWYLERWASTEAALSRALWRRAERVMREHPADRDEVGQWIAGIVAFSVEQGFVNDRRYAEDIVRSHRRKGVAERKTRSKLRLKGVEPVLIDEVMRGADPDQELRSAFTYARRRRLGPFRRRPVDREGKQKELAKLGRAGFGFDTARQVVDAESVEEAEAYGVSRGLG